MRKVKGVGDMGQHQIKNNLINRYSKRLFWSLTLLLTTTSSEARNGFIPHYVGLDGIIAGGGVALPLDVGGTIGNPAFLTRLPSHFLATIGVLAQNQHVDATQMLIGNKAVGRQTNHYKAFPIGALGASYKINPCWAIGFALSGGGGFVKFKHSITNPALHIPVNGNFDRRTVNQVVLIASSVSYQPSAKQSYGISLLVATSDFKSDLALPNGMGQFTEVTGRNRADRVWGAGVRIGGLWDLNNALSVGLSAATPVYCQRHDKYKQLFNHNHKFQVPATARFGITWHVSPKTDISLDYKELFYGQAKWAKKNLGWHDQIILIGSILHRVTDQLDLGIGYNFGKVPFKKSKVIRNDLTLAIDEHHLSGGFNYKTQDKKMELFLVTFFCPRNHMRDNGRGTPGGVSRGLKISNMSYGFELGTRLNF